MWPKLSQKNRCERCDHGWLKQIFGSLFEILLLLYLVGGAVVPLLVQLWWRAAGRCLQIPRLVASRAAWAGLISAFVYGIPEDKARGLSNSR